MRMPALLLALGATLLAQGHNRSENRALLGVVALEEKGAVILGHVLARSPAAKAKLRKGDVLESIDGRAIKRHDDVDAALAGLDPGDAIAVVVTREGARRETKVKLIERRKYRGEFLKSRKRRGATGFRAPPWHAFAWANLPEGAKAPTRENTKGKVVVIHAFQSW